MLKRAEEDSLSELTGSVSVSGKEKGQLKLPLTGILCQLLGYAEYVTGFACLSVKLIQRFLMGEKTLERRMVRWSGIDALRIFFWNTFNIAT